MRKTVLAALAALVVIASERTASAASTEYVRSQFWDTAVTDTAKGSDSESNVSGNVWKYEIVDGTGLDTVNGLNGSAPWYSQPNATGKLFTWSGSNNRWEGNGSSNYPRISASGTTYSINNTGPYGWQGRIHWVAPEAGTATISGSIGVKRQTDNLADTIEWAIGKRSGTTYTPLASGAQEVPAGGVSLKVPVDSFAALQNISMAVGDDLWWTARGIDRTVATNTLEVFLDNDATSGTQLKVTFTPSSSVSDWAKK